MRVMWFTNMPMPAVGRRSGLPARGTGSWMVALIEALVQQKRPRLAVVTVCPGRTDDHFEEEGVAYHVVGSRSRRYSSGRGTAPLLGRCADIVTAWCPDIVHVHGTETFYGLLGARNLIDVPVIIGIQGLLREFHRSRNYFGALSLSDIVRSVTLRGLVAGHGLLWARRNYGRRALQEDEIIKGNSFFIGQTLWDLSHVKAGNSRAVYYRVGRVLREPFGRCEWDIRRCRRYNVIFTNAGAPFRGVETLLEAATILRREVPDIRLRLAGAMDPRDGYCRFLRRRIARSPLASCVEILGYLDARAMAEALAESHVFVIPSYMENESLSLCEAMRVGMPCIATHAGGLPSTLMDEKTGLQFPPGDSAILAQQIRRVFEDDDLAVRLGAAAKFLAKDRHDPERVVSELLDAYQDVLRRCGRNPKAGAELPNV